MCSWCLSPRTPARSKWFGSSSYSSRVWPCVARRASVGFGPCGGEPTCGGGVRGWGVTTFRVGTFVVVSDVCVGGGGEGRIGGTVWVHEGKRGSPMARGDAVARVAAWSERPAPPHHSLWAARRAQLSSLLERTVTNAHGLRDMSVHKPRRCQCALFIRVRFCTVYLVIKLSPGTPLLRVGALSSCLDLLRRGQSVRRVCGDPETCGLLRRNSRCRECTRA